MFRNASITIPPIPRNLYIPNSSKPNTKKMGIHTNYHRLTIIILTLKRFFSEVHEEKFDQFKNLLINYEYDSLDENAYNVPTA